jgi:hypothetical protein
LIHLTRDLIDAGDWFTFDRHQPVARLDAGTRRRTARHNPIRDHPAVALNPADAVVWDYELS